MTDIDAASAELDVVFYILARTDDGISAVTPSITVTLSCVDVTSITTTYTSGNGVAIVVDYTTDGFFYKIFVEELGTTSTVDLTAVATYVTDRPDDSKVQASTWSLMTQALPHTLALSSQRQTLL